MHNRRDVVAGTLLALIGIGVIVWAIRLQVGTLVRPLPGSFPLVVGLMIVFLSIAIVVQGWLGRGKSPQPYGDLRRPSILVAGLAVYTVILDSLGYLLSTIFIAVVTLRLMGVTSWKVIGVSSVILSVVVYFLFTRFLEVELPAGILPF
jgi:putative tricarboxylic transport membrane protein